MSLSQNLFNIITGIVVLVVGSLIFKYERNIRKTLQIKPESINRLLLFGVVMFIIGLNVGVTVTVSGNKRKVEIQLKEYERVVKENLMLRKNAALFRMKFIMEEEVPDSLDSKVLRTISEQCLFNGGDPANRSDRNLVYQQLSLFHSVTEFKTGFSLLTQ